MNIKPRQLILQSVFYLFVLTILISRSASVGFSHDENQFITAGQLLADHGLLPYVDYPYTHMPYGAFFYALTARLSSYDYLAGRLLNAVTFLICGLLIVQAFRLISGAKPSLVHLLWEFTIVYIFLNHPITSYIIGAALNHSLAALFSLLALAFFIGATQGRLSPVWAAFGSGICISMASLIRFNYASLIVVSLFLWFLYGFFAIPRRVMTILMPFIAGLFLAGLPALVLLVLAPRPFYYGNIAYIRLNMLYYQQLLVKSNMDIGSKIASFFTGLFRDPLDLMLYFLLLYMGLTSLLNYQKNRSVANLNRLAVATFALTLLLTAFTPTPTVQHYFFDAVPFLMLILALLGSDLFQEGGWRVVLVWAGSLALLFLSTRISNPVEDITNLFHPSQWTPLQVHDFAFEIKQYVPGGRVLTLLPMIPLEAGYDVYPFTATGPFSWRTSLLLTAQRRAQYGVISPDELNGLLEKAPPAAILTGFESTNAGFNYLPNSTGGLEAPFIAYAHEKGYEAVPMNAQFLHRTVTLWVRPR